MLLVASVVLSVSGCAVLPEPETPRASREENFKEPEQVPELVVGGSAIDNLPYFHETLRLFALGSEPTQGEPIVNVLVAAGFEKGAMQVSFDESQTGLVADSMFVSVRINDQCLLGQVVTSSRDFVAETGAAVGPNRDLCLIGNTRPIDW